ncbi:hypothetical protein Tco_1136671 [Tanacetum coccineum]
MEEVNETDEHEEVEVDDEAELKKHLVIVKYDDIAIDAIPLATKPLVIVEYKLLKEGIMVHYQLIRAVGSFKRYSSMIRMLQGIIFWAHMADCNPSQTPVDTESKMGDDGDPVFDPTLY